MNYLRTLKAQILGQESIEASPEELRDASVPVSDADCRNCADPCDHGHDEYPYRFDVDRETQLFGTLKPYRRQVVISTGKTDWVREVTDDTLSLAGYLSAATKSSKPPKGDKGEKGEKGGKKVKEHAAIFTPSGQSRIAILNGSHHTLSHEDNRETVLIFPDYKVVIEVDRSQEGAELLYKTVVDPSVSTVGAPMEGSHLRSFILPYSAVILICSHKKRDNRCSISAPKLEHGFTTALEREGWEVHTQLDDPSDHSSAIEAIQGTEEEKESEILRIRKSFDFQNTEQKRALILKNSHIGGHKFAGNCIIYTPHSVGVWYGRVTPHNCDAIVEETIIKGKVLPPLLRGGMNLAQPDHQSLNEW